MLRQGLFGYVLPAQIVWVTASFALQPEKWDSHHCSSAYSNLSKVPKAVGTYRHIRCLCGPRRGTKANVDWSLISVHVSSLLCWKHCVCRKRCDPNNNNTGPTCQHITDRQPYSASSPEEHHPGSFKPCRVMRPWRQLSQSVCSCLL